MVLIVGYGMYSPTEINHVGWGGMGKALKTVPIYVGIIDLKKYAVLGA
jgi:hypothetical protein